MSEQPRSSDPSERPETLVERLEALSAKWRDAAVWQFDQCADELEAALASRAAAPQEREYDRLSDRLEAAGLPALECAEGQSCGSLDAVRALLSRLAPAAPPECAWTLMDQEDDLTVYETSCGHAWQFMDGGPTENRMRFCPYCGSHLVVPTPAAEKE